MSGAEGVGDGPSVGSIDSGPSVNYFSGRKRAKGEGGGGGGGQGQGGGLGLLLDRGKGGGGGGGGGGDSRGLDDTMEFMEVGRMFWDGLSGGEGRTVSRCSVFRWVRPVRCCPYRSVLVGSLL